MAASFYGPKPRERALAVKERRVSPMVPGGPSSRFAERPVQLGAPVEDSLNVLEGLKPGDLVVTAGSFFLRAGADALG